MACRGCVSALLRYIDTFNNMLGHGNRVVADVWETFFSEETPKCGSGRMWDLGAQGGSAKAPARNNAPGGCTARATRAWRRDAPKVAILEAPCAQNALGRSTNAHRKHCYPEIPLGGRPTSQVSQSSRHPRPSVYVICPSQYFGRPLMHHQNVSLQDAPSKRNLLTSLKRSKAGPPQLRKVKKVRFDGAFCSDTF